MKTVFAKPRKVSDLNRVLVNTETGALYRSAGTAAAVFGCTPAFVIMVAAGRATSPNFKVAWVDLSKCELKK